MLFKLVRKRERKESDSQIIMTRSAFFSFLFARLKYGRKIDIKHAEKHREALQRNKKPWVSRIIRE